MNSAERLPADSILPDAAKEAAVLFYRKSLPGAAFSAAAGYANLLSFLLMPEAYLPGWQQWLYNHFKIF